MRHKHTYILSLSVMILLAACSDLKRTNPLDPKNPNSINQRVVLAELFVGTYLDTETIIDTLDSLTGVTYDTTPPPDTVYVDTVVIDSIDSSESVWDTLYDTLTRIDTVILDTQYDTSYYRVFTDTSFDTAYNISARMQAGSFSAAEILDGLYRAHGKEKVVYAIYPVMEHYRDTLLSEDDTVFASWYQSYGPADPGLDSLPAAYLNHQEGYFSGENPIRNSLPDSLSGLLDRECHYLLEGTAELTATTGEIRMTCRIARLGTADSPRGLTVQLIYLRSTKWDSCDYVAWRTDSYDLPVIQAGGIHEMDDITLDNTYGLNSISLSIIICLRDADHRVLQAILIESL